MLLPLLRRVQALVLDLRFEAAQQDSLLRHIAETELQADMREQASQGRDEGVPELRALAAALRHRAGLSPARGGGAPTGLGGAPLRPRAQPAPAPAPPFPLEETFAAGRERVRAALIAWEEFYPGHRPDIREQLQEALASLDLGPILAVYAGAQDRAALAPVLETWDKALGRLAHVDPGEVPETLRAELGVGIEQLVAVRGEIKRRDRASRPAGA